jgi:hypothetical protein
MVTAFPTVFIVVHEIRFTPVSRVAIAVTPIFVATRDLTEATETLRCRVVRRTGYTAKPAVIHIPLEVSFTTIVYVSVTVVEPGPAIVSAAAVYARLVRAG